MTRTARAAIALAVSARILGVDVAYGQPARGPIDLTVAAGRPVRVALAERLTITHVGQPVAGTVVEPMYAYDRIVIPVGTAVLGRIARLDNPPKAARVRAFIGGDFSPHRTIVVTFDTIVKDGEAIPIRTVVMNASERVTHQVVAEAETDAADGVIAKGKRQVAGYAKEKIREMKRKVRDGVAALKDGNKWQRAREFAVAHLPYHNQVLAKGTVFDAELQAPLAFGTVDQPSVADAGTKPSPGSVLSARLVTPLDSRMTPRGTPLEAIVTRPVFSSSGALVVPEGTRLIGQVTFAKPARRFHRNGQLRFLIERMERPSESAMPILASLHSIDVAEADGVALDDEGGASVTNSRTRFIAPALALLALHGTVDHDRRRFDNDADDVGATGQVGVRSGHFGPRALGGFFGFGLVGVAVSQISRPAAVAFGLVGAARTIYTNVLGRGRELRFVADTPIEVQLAPSRGTDR
jgi:hypothetical protein